MKTTYSVLLLLCLLFACQKIDLIRVAVVKTGVANSITETEANINGEVIDTGGKEVTYGHCYATTPSPTVSQAYTQIGVGARHTPFSSSLKNIQPNTTYYVRAYMQSVDGVVYSNEVSFKTNPIVPTTIVTGNAANITETTMQMTSTVSALGTGINSLLRHGHCYSSTNNVPTINDNLDNLGIRNVIGNFTSTVSNLAPARTYYVRAYADNGREIVYGSVRTVQTLTPPEPDAFLKKITIVTFPATVNSLPWDPCDFSLPDLYLVITTRNGNVTETLVNTKEQNPALILPNVSTTARAFFEFTSEVLLQKNRNYSIEIWDRDTGLCGTDELVGSVPLNVSSYPARTAKVSVKNNNTEMEFDLIWK